MISTADGSMNAEEENLARARPAWLATQATVTGCHYEFAGINSLSAGLPCERRQFRICFTYRAHGITFTDAFMSERAVAQGEVFPLRYNPLRPSQNTKSDGAGKAPLLSIGIAVSIIMALLFLAMARGCG